MFGLLGPNGAGKTTTILMMLGLTEISSGQVSVLGFDPARAPLEVKRRVGYLPDSVGFYDHLTAMENLAYTAKLMGLSLRRARAAHRGRAGAGAAARSRAQARRDLLARHAAAAGACRDHRQARRDRDPRRADLRPRSAGDDRIPRPDRRVEARRHHGAAVLASARPGAAHLRPRRAVPGRPHRDDGHGRASLRVQVLGAGFVVEVEAEGNGIARRLVDHPGRDQGRDAWRRTASA